MVAKGKWRRSRELLFNGDRVLVWEDEKVQDLNSSDSVKVLTVTKPYEK